MELEDGKTYTLTRDVPNPQADKRHKYDTTKWPVWKKGYIFQVTERDHGTVAGIDIKSKDIIFVDTRGRRCSPGRIDDSDNRFQLLADAAEPTAQTLTSLKKRLGFNYSDILEQLLIDGDIDILDIEAANERLHERWDKEGVT